jgi:hypothetical protein
MPVATFPVTAPPSVPEWHKRSDLVQDDVDMTGSGTQANGSGLPMVIGERRPRPTLLRLAPRAAFLSQLIAEREHLAPQRQRRQLPPLQAVDAYAAGSSIAVPRLPAGYRRTVVA